MSCACTFSHVPFYFYSYLLMLCLDLFVYTANIVVFLITAVNITSSYGLFLVLHLFSP